MWKKAGASAKSTADMTEGEISPARPRTASSKPRGMMDTASAFISTFSAKTVGSRYEVDEEEEREKEFMMADDPSMRARWDVVDLRTLSMGLCFASILVAGAIPLVEQFIWYKHDPRLTEIVIVNWVVAGFSGLLGLGAVASKNSNIIAFHVIVGGMLGAALGLYSVMIYYDMKVRCEIMQAAYVGCSGCTCSLQNRCSKEDLLADECASCAAWPTEVCAAISAFSLTSIMGLVAVFAASVPACLNLVLLLRMEAQVGEAFKIMKGLDTSELEHQMELLAVGAEPTARPTSINLLIDRVRDHGDTTLAEKARAALNVYKAVRRGPPTENRVTLKNIAKRAQAPAMFNVATLAAKKAADEAEEAGGTRAGAGGSNTASPSASGFGKRKNKLKIETDSSGSADAGGEEASSASRLPSAMKKSSRPSSGQKELRLSGSTDGGDDERPYSAPNKSNRLKGILGKKGGLSAASKAAAPPEASNTVESVSISIDSDDEDELSPAGAGPSAISRDLMMSRFSNPQDESGFTKGLVSTFELDD